MFMTSPCDDDVATILLCRQPFEDAERDLGFLLAKQVHLLWEQADFMCKVADVLRRLALGNGKVTETHTQVSRSLMSFGIWL